MQRLPAALWFSLVMAIALAWLFFSHSADFRFHELFLVPLVNTLWFITGWTYVSTESGYLFSQPNILIDRSCSGMQVGVLIFLLGNALSYFQFSKAGIRLLLMIPLVVAAWLLSIAGNVFRIMTSIFGQEAGNFLWGVRPHFFLHDLIGWICNFLLIVMAYLLLQKLFSFIPNYEPKT